MAKFDMTAEFCTGNFSPVEKSLRPLLQTPVQKSRNSLPLTPFPKNEGKISVSPKKRRFPHSIENLHFSSEKDSVPLLLPIKMLSPRFLVWKSLQLVGRGTPPLIYPNTCNAVECTPVNFWEDKERGNFVLKDAKTYLEPIVIISLVLMRGRCWILSFCGISLWDWHLHETS